MKHYTLSLPMLFLVVIAYSQPAVKLQWQSEKLAPGLRWQSTHTDQLYNSRQSINVLKVNTRKRALALAYVTDTLLRTSELAMSNQALAAVNAGFFKIREGRGSATYLKVNGQVIDDLPTQGHALLTGALIIEADGDLQIEYAQANEVYI